MKLVLQRLWFFNLTSFGMFCWGLFMMSMLSLLTTADIAQASHTQAAPMNNLGMNINNVRDWSTIRSFADIMKHCRRWHKIGDWNDAGFADIDENGWPVEDAQTVVAVLDRLDGTYKLSFEGQANIDVPGARVVDKIYDEATNVTTASVIIETTSKINFFIKFTNTNDGVRNIKLMRPITCGSEQTYDESRVFTDQFLTFCRFFQVIVVFFRSSALWIGWPQTATKTASKKDGRIVRCRRIAHRFLIPTIQVTHFPTKAPVRAGNISFCLRMRPALMYG